MGDWSCRPHSNQLVSIISITGEDWGTIWMSVLPLAKTRKVAAVIFSYDRPNYRTLMLLVRACVKRHHRIPAKLVVDNAPEFHSLYFEIFCAMYGIEIIWRAPGEPRGGSVCESLFGLTE